MYIYHYISSFRNFELSFLREGMFCCHYLNSRHTDDFFRLARYFSLFTDNLTSIKVFQNYNLKDHVSIYRPARTTTLDFENPQYISIGGVNVLFYHQ